jgi:hypothetical protein
MGFYSIIEGWLGIQLWNTIVVCEMTLFPPPLSPFKFRADQTKRRPVEHFTWRLRWGPRFEPRDKLLVYD